MGPRGPEGDPGPVKVIDIEEKKISFVTVNKRRKRSADQIPESQDYAFTQPSIGALIAKINDKIKTLQGELEQYNKPLGTKDSPARHCRDILAQAENKAALNSGKYWIDPNLGSTSDAIEVECKFQQGTNEAKTCVSPLEILRERKLTNFVKSENPNDWWLSGLLKQVNNVTGQWYYAPRNQLGYLQLLHTRAEQAVVLMCKNSVVYYDNRAKSHANAINMILFNEQRVNTYQDRAILNAGDNKVLEIKVQDNCLDSPSHRGTTKFDFISKDPSLLPLVDMQLTDFGRKDQAIGYYVEEVCYI